AFVGQATPFVAQYIVMKEISSEPVATQPEGRPSVPSLPLTTLISLPRAPLPRLDQSSQIKVDKGGSNQIKPKRFFSRAIKVGTRSTAFHRVPIFAPLTAFPNFSSPSPPRHSSCASAVQS